MYPKKKRTKKRHYHVKYTYSKIDIRISKISSLRLKFRFLFLYQKHIMHYEQNYSLWRSYHFLHSTPSSGPTVSGERKLKILLVYNNSCKTGNLESVVIYFYRYMLRHRDNIFLPVNILLKLVYAKSIQRNLTDLDTLTFSYRYNSIGIFITVLSVSQLQILSFSLLHILHHHEILSSVGNNLQLIFARLDDVDV